MNTNKKILIIIAVSILLIGGFFVYIYSNQIKSSIQGSNNQETQQENTQDSKLQFGPDSPSVEIETVEKSGLLICVDKCGDGTCQEGEDKCNNLNCICREDKQECPQDCK